MTSPRVLRILAASVSVVLAAGGCGTQMTEDQLKAGVGAQPVEGVTAVAGVGANGDPGLAMGGAAIATTSGPTTVTGPTSSTGGTARGSTGAAVATPRANGRASAAEARPGAGATVACQQTLSPIIIGQTLAASGVVGSVFLNLRAGLQVWARAVNARGGVQCHPVQIISLDDASDTARVAANMRELVQRGAVAIVGAGVPIATASLRSSAEQLKVPVIGGDQVTPDWNQSPYMFPVGASTATVFAGAIKEASQASGKTKLGMIYCVEASICTYLNEKLDDMAKRANVTVVARKGTSISQTDYTGECQAMKSAGVDLLLLSIDGASSARIVRSCAGLNYHPPIASTGFAAIPSVLNDPNVRKNQLYLGSATAPYVAHDSAALQEFHAAFKTYSPSTELDQTAMTGWTSGKMFEVVLQSVGARAKAGNVTTDLVMSGVDGVVKETLGGLAGAVTYRRGQPTPDAVCYFPLKIDANGVGAPRGGKAACF